MFKALQSMAALVSLLLAAACGRGPAADAPAGDAAPSTVRANAQVAASLPLADAQDFEDARRGLIARPSGQIVAADGTVLRDFEVYAFLDARAPPTVNPSLWRHAQLNAQIGLFKVTDGVYQLRGFDLANLTLIEGKTGWIVVDPLTAAESARFAMAFADKHLGKRPVSAIVFTHAHIDHFGGVLGLMTAAEAAQRKTAVIAPAGFMEEATSENVMMAAAMGRRSLYQFGRDLPRSALGNVDTGLGKDLVYGQFGILQPTVIIDRPVQPLQVDGLDFVFHNVPGAEAPAELTFSIPSLKLYDGAENLSQTMHNLLPIRGAKVRDALRWSVYLDDALQHTKEAEVYIASHNWPIWGRPRIRQFITAHRDIYKYTHDQTVRLMNAGHTAREIADLVQLPPSLARQLGARGHYGDLRHNVKAVYQFYLGFYDGNPAHLDPLPPQASATRYVELAGGADKLVANAQAAYDKGEYRWAAEVLNHAVLADAANPAAKALLARTYEQMAYMAEAATWRNAYLTAALELRQGPPIKGVPKANAIDMLLRTPTERFLEAMAAGLDGPAAVGKNLKINLRLTDVDEQYVLWIENAVLHFRRAAPAADASASLSLSKGLLVKMIAGTAGIKDTLLGDDLQVDGSRLDLLRFFTLIDQAPGNFAIVTR
jgi:alkyl sulfatase BDS1-like metallo-beta-lactamase superfamily hydrolase